MDIVSFTQTFLKKRFSHLSIDFQHDEDLIPRLPVNSGHYTFHDWNINYTKSHILKSVCINGNTCKKDEPSCCDLCMYVQEVSSH